MPDRDKVISHFHDAIEASGKGNRWRFVRVDIIEDAIELLKEQEYARCLNCQFRDFGENEVDNWDRCKLHRHNTSPDEYCSWFVERAGEVGC